jgi:hypothetical protein
MAICRLLVQKVFRRVRPTHQFSLAKQGLCLQGGSQAGDWEPETKVFGGAGILPVRVHRLKACATKRGGQPGTHPNAFL